MQDHLWSAHAFFLCSNLNHVYHCRIIYGISQPLYNDAYFQNSVWLTFVTTSTVGYGDFTPKTHWGRTVAAFIAVSGLIMAVRPTPSRTISNFERICPVFNF